MQAIENKISELKSGQSNPDALYQIVCRTMIDHIQCTRASIWHFNLLGDEITCSALFDTRNGEFSKGLVLTEDDFPEYFAAIKKDGKIVASDALTNPSTMCFDDVYFTLLDIRSLLDFVVMKGSRPVMVLCCEHCVTKKEWTLKDYQQLNQIASMLHFEVNS